MPDLRTALQSALNQWNPGLQPEETMQPQQTQTPSPATPTPLFAATNNVCRETFNYVKANPGKTNREICKHLEAMGYKRTSVSSLLAQMHHVDMLRRATDGTYSAIANEYYPIKVKVLRKRQKAAPIRTNNHKPVPQPKAAAPAPIPTPAPKPVTLTPPVRSVDDLIDSLTVGQARELFNALKKMFV